MGGNYGSESRPNTYHELNHRSIMLVKEFRIYISPWTGVRLLSLGLQEILVTTFQLLLTAGVGAVFIINYAIEGIYVSEAMFPDADPRFASEYDELMWLAERQKHHSDRIETKRFFQLRHNWSEMHSLPVAGHAV